MKSTILAIKIGLEINKYIYNPLVKYKKQCGKFDGFVCYEYFLGFLHETIERFDINDIEYFKFETWNVSIFNDVYAHIVNVCDKYYKLVGNALFHALKRVFEDIRDLKI